MSRPFAHQDACGQAGARIAVFVGGAFHSYVDTTTDPHGDITAQKVAASLGANQPSVEALTVCINHPTEAAVDCLTCDPLED
ncbi:hypothetical protein ABZY58_11100 [Micromonospora tulbaghiae]|uniref:hypothetical protein n=1 Tax=Micromonospora tulbaghiae TaxID=479978 RepID=UPI0033A6DE28